MFASRRKFFSRVFYFVLSMAYIVVVGLPFSNEYYRFSNLPRTHEKRSAVRHAALYSSQSKNPRWHPKAKVLLDKRYSPGQLYCFSSLLFSLPITIDGPKQV